MKAGIVHFDLNACGGAEYVCLNIAKALHDSGHDVGLCTMRYPNCKDINERLGIDVKDNVDLFFSMQLEQIPFFEIYQRIVYSHFAIKKLSEGFKPDLLIITLYPLSIVPEALVRKTVMYVHNPIDLKSVESYRMTKFIRQIYFKPMQFILENLETYKEVALLTNSKYSAMLIEQLWDRNADIVYPPCPLHTQLPLDEKRDWVCTLARFSPEKNYELAIEIARRLPKIEFHFVGTAIPSKRFYLNRIIDAAKSSKNVHFHVNASFQEKTEVLKRSKALLHTMHGEHFGISLVEGLSSGTIPVPHNSGGAKEDGFVPARFRWENVEEAVNIIDDCISKWNENLARKLRQSSGKFSQENFRLDIISSLRAHLM